jgi:hypothetical protein
MVLIDTDYLYVEYFGGQFAIAMTVPTLLCLIVTFLVTSLVLAKFVL